MDERILIISDNKRDWKFFEQILEPKGFDIKGMSLSKKIEDTILKSKILTLPSLQITI